MALLMRIRRAFFCTRSDSPLSKPSSFNRPNPMLSTDFDQIMSLLPDETCTILELGCGKAVTTRKLAEARTDCNIVATEVDQLQLQKNLADEPLPNLEFLSGGAESINFPDNSFDFVILLKSFHHVPVQKMSQSLREIRRVLKVSGFAYISEPVYAGQFNEILKIFHDEKSVRQAAIDAIESAIQEGLFVRNRKWFFDSILRFQGFNEFEDLVLSVTHSQFDIDAEKLAQIKSRFNGSLNDNGIAEFETPQRVELLSCR